RLKAAEHPGSPRFFRQEEHALAIAQRTHQVAHQATREAVTERGNAEEPNLENDEVWPEVSQDGEEREAWKQRQKRRKGVARTHERARWKHGDFAHQPHRAIVNPFDGIALEDLRSTNRGENGHLAKSIAWGPFREWTAWAARRSIAVHPADTSADSA